MRVLIFSLVYYPDFVGGAEIAVKEITDRLAPEELEFEMITLRLSSALPRFERVGNINVYRIGLSSGKRILPSARSFILFANKFLFPLMAFPKALSLHLRRRYDVAWAIMANQAGFAALFFNLLFPRARLLLTLQEGDPIAQIKRKVRFIYPVFKRIFKRASAVQAISTFLSEFARDMGAAGEVYVVPNGVDAARFGREWSAVEKDAARDRLNIEKGETILLTTSRLVRKNAVDDIIRAMTLLPPEVKLMVIGDGPERRSLEKLTGELYLKERVRFVGFVSHREIPVYYSVAHIFVRPSRSEGMGNSFMEAFAAGLPVIATPVGGIPDFLRDGETGFFCDVDRPGSIAEKVKLLLDAPNMRKEIVKNGRALARQKYDWNIIAGSMEEIFNGLMNE